ncbi:DUF2752 domain-containing protein [Thalassoglobus sp.]|uniref:DUF2752 domain-containing protein n=1 Tax=Thalassoglobus sp. TaxID=2795869 RepID=UPI003AA9E206
MSLNSIRSYPITRSIRWLLLAGSVCVLGGYYTASTVDPDPRGFGTHQQFGFPPCSFRVFIGVPCPSCGGTTSVAYFVRGQWIDSLKSNTAVFVLAFLGLVYLPWSLLSLKAGRLLGVVTPSHFVVTILVTLSVIAVVQWGWRLLT